MAGITKPQTEICLFDEQQQIICEISSAAIVKLLKEIVSSDGLDFKFLTIY